MNDKLTTVLIVVILGLLIYLAFKPGDDKKYLELLKRENAKIVKQIEANQVLINERLDSIKIIETKEIIIKNYYNEIYNSIDTITSDYSGIAYIRQWLDSLGTARFR